MKNKFLEYLVNSKLKDLTYNMREIDTERDKMYNSNQLEEYIYFDDLFKFLFELNVTQEEIFTAIRKENASFSLADILIGREFQNDKNRKEKLDMFKPLIENNINFYKQMMSVVLNDHMHIRDEFKQRNQDFFEELVDTGLKKGFFSAFSKEQLQTKNLAYKKVLIDKNVFDTNYDINETMKVMHHVNGKYQKEEIVRKHFSMYSTDIYNFLKDLDENKLKDFKDKLGKELKFEEQNYEKEFKRNFNQFIYFLIEVEQENALPLLKNSIVRESIINTDSYNNNAIAELIQTPKMLSELLNLINEFEGKELFKIESYHSGLVIKYLTEYSKDKAYIDEELIVQVMEGIEKYSLDSNDLKKELITTQILFNNAQKISNQDFISKLFEKNTKSIVKSLIDHNDNMSGFKYQDRMLKFQKLEKTINSQIWNKIKSKIEIGEKDSLYKFKQNLNNQRGSLTYEDRKYVEGLSKYIDQTNDVSVLSVLNADPENPEWKSLKFSHNDGKKHYEEENIIAYLLRNAANESIKLELINWVIEESIDNFYEIKLGNKDILSYYLKESENAKVKSTTYVKIIDKILENEVTFEKLLKNNKVKLKGVLAIDNEDIKKKLNYHLLNQKLNDKVQNSDEIVQTKVKNKI